MKCARGRKLIDRDNMPAYFIGAWRKPASETDDHIKAKAEFEIDRRLNRMLAESGLSIFFAGPNRAACFKLEEKGRIVSGH
jgi:hypothetical protein